MIKYNQRSRIFNLGSVGSKFADVISNINQTIDRDSENYILNVNETEYVKHLVDSNIIDKPVISFDEVYADSYEEDIPAEYFPTMYFDVYRGQKYKKQIIQFFIPISGNINMLLYSPVSSMYVDGEFFIKNDTLVCEFINFYNDAVKIKKDYDSKVSYLVSIYSKLIQDIDDFNNCLGIKIREIFLTRKSKILNKNNLMESLGVPLKKATNVSNTFSIPQPKLREKISIKPSVIENGYKSEPTLDGENYFNILKLINDVGKNFERLPNVYKSKHEEDLRDHFLLTLDPNFEFGSVSGETFNKTGKTDIQLRYDSSVVFIAECKFWNGEKSYLNTISQLLKYLTWRDTKASIIMFVTQKDFSSILNKINHFTSYHDNYLGYVSNSDENWFNYRFHVNGDKNREVKLAVQLFHLPK